MQPGETIKENLQRLRRALARHVLICGFYRVGVVILGLGFLLVVLEGWAYYSSATRQQICGFFLFTAGILLTIPIIYYFLVLTQRLSQYDDLHLAKRIGATFPHIKDSLVNVLQLEGLLRQRAPGFSVPLVEQSIAKVAQQLAETNLLALVPEQRRQRDRRRLLFSIVCIGVAWLIFPRHLGSAWSRLIHSRQEYAVPLPFTIQSLTGTREILGGDSLTLKFSCQGRYPHHLNLRLSYPTFEQKQPVTPDTNGLILVKIPALRQDLIYEAYAENRGLFKPWRRISSGQDTIRIINRPEILRVVFNIAPPVYTQLPVQRQESNNPEILLYKGSTVALEVLANKPISQGTLNFSQGPIIRLAIRGTRALASFQVYREDEFTINLTDEQQITNRDPLRYHLRIQPDNYPSVTLLNPKGDYDLTEEMTIPLTIRISDDFGFSRMAIVYRLLKNYAPEPAAEQEKPFPLRELDKPLQELFYLWNVGDLNLAPEDAVEFRIDVYDNDVVSGPKKGTSTTIRARFPSLNELFAAVQGTQEEISEQGAEIAAQLRQTQQALEEVARELLKKPNVSWEQKKQLENEARKTEQAAEKLEQLGQKVEQLIKAAERNQLWTPETLAKYAQLQQAFEEIMTPELRAALRQLQQALEKMDAQAVKQALDNFKINQQQFSQELDRLLQIFKRIKIEQAVDELAKRFTELAEHQRTLDSNLSAVVPEDKKRLEQLAAEQEAIRKDTEIARDIMERTARDMEEFPYLPTKELAELHQDLEAREVLTNQKEARQALQKGDKASATNKTHRSSLDLKELAKAMEKYRQEFSKRSLEEVLKDFQQVLNKTLQLSQLQEKLQKEIAQTPRQSEQVMDVAVKQSELYQSLGTILNDLMQLANKTFGVTPRIGKGMGEAAGGMRRTIEQLEERNVSAAGTQAQKATQALNRTAIEVLAAMKQLQQSGSASGFENYLEQLRQLSGAQQGLNDETQMVAMGSGGDQLTLQRLAARQQQIKQSLEQLQQEMSGQSKQGGDLGGIVQDMEEVIKDLKNNQVLRKTIERQQRILSRLLDAQQSLRTQDYKEERVSKTGEEIVRSSPQGLPGDLGLRRNLLQENLEKALRDGYRREYQDLIRRYFESLRQEAAQ